MEHLLEPCRKGDKKAQHELYQRMAPVLMGMCRRYLTRIEEAEEALSNAFIKIFTKLDSYTGEGNFEGWMKRITVRECLSYLRKGKNPFDLDWEGEVVAPATYSDGAAHLLLLVQALPVGYRTVFNLYAMEGYKHDEIAEMLDISVGTSKSQLSKARKLLKEQLPEYSNQDAK
jgi:RNA polymerase sigma-70 factor (ECF subfamily)